jgi:hypothetical protein
VYFRLADVEYGHVVILDSDGKLFSGKQDSTWVLAYLVVGVNKPLSGHYQHEPQPGQLTNYVPEILLFVEKNLLEPPDRSGVYLSQRPVDPLSQGLVTTFKGPAIYHRSRTIVSRLFISRADVQNRTTQRPWAYFVVSWKCSLMQAWSKLAAG